MGGGGGRNSAVSGINTDDGNLVTERNKLFREQKPKADMKLVVLLWKLGQTNKQTTGCGSEVICSRLRRVRS